MPMPYRGMTNEITVQMTAQGPQASGRLEPCSHLELNTAECYEVYGLAKGSLVCQKFAEDLSECRTSKMRGIRNLIVKKERLKKVIKGELTWAQRWGKPYDSDSYIQGTFFP